MALIKLTQGKHAIVDDADLPLVSQYAWRALKTRYGRFYAQTSLPRIPGRPRRAVYLHRLIMSAKRGQYVDHVDGNGLDNRRTNLRFCSQSQNMANWPIRKVPPSGSRGVLWSKQKGKWHAIGRLNRKAVHLGFFDDVEAATTARDSWVKQTFGQFATPNRR